MTPRPLELGELEQAVLQLVADVHPVSAGEVAQRIAEQSGQARTTVLTVIERLRRKKLLTRTKSGGLFMYSPQIEKQDLLPGMIQSFVDRVLAGSVSPLLVYLSDSRRLKKEEREQLRRMLQDLDSKPEK